MSLSRSFVALTAGFVLATGFVWAHDHKKPATAPVVASAPVLAAAVAPACEMPDCAHGSAPGEHCAMAEKGAANSSAPAGDCPCCGHAGAHGSAPMECTHHGSAPMACAHGSAPMKCAAHDAAVPVATDSAPAASGMTGCQGMAMAGSSAPAATAPAAAPAPVKAAVVHQRKGDGVKTCPVSGDAVDPKVETVINGRKVKFCCLDCAKEAAADPATFIAGDAGVPAN